MLAAFITDSTLWVGFFGGAPVWLALGFLACLACVSLAIDFLKKRRA